MRACVTGHHEAQKNSGQLVKSRGRMSLPSAGGGTLWWRAVNINRFEVNAIAKPQHSLSQLLSVIAYYSGKILLITAPESHYRLKHVLDLRKTLSGSVKFVMRFI